MATSETKTTTRRKLGLMGGTFDPVHNGHLLIANEAGWRLGLDKVLFIPTGDPPHKQDHYITPARHRLEMVRRATQDNPLFEVSAIELNGPVYLILPRPCGLCWKILGRMLTFILLSGWMPPPTC